ncbi:O-antigen ligase family protein [Patescibacteria group bacterium]|nr:O-antigen ligase family protein [Patescibacteria group bacterium]MBU1472167.1 O-antigen ligase family protein [Patescibacteria group bacterium]MBU2459561.1 O-antigen ligase family protein [Patescibacteria group bacterium]MBU2544198.1 O-antigen ligase family protein [Patescibacteria group bacterium]
MKSPITQKTKTIARLLYKKIRRSRTFKRVSFRAQTIVLSILLIMFLLGYLESMRWPISGPKATHGILKGLFLLLAGCLIFLPLPSVRTRLHKQNYLMMGFVLAIGISTLFSQVPEASLLYLWYPFMSAAIVFAFSKIRLPRGYLMLFLALSAVLVIATFTFTFFSLLFRYEVDPLYYFLFLEHRANYLLSELRYYGKYASLGPYIMLVPLCALFLVKNRASIIQKLFSSLVIFVGVLTAVMSNNRIDAIVIFIELIFVLWLMPRKTAAIVLLVSLPIVWFGMYTSQRYFGFNLEDRFFRPRVERDLETIDLRFTYWDTALKNFKSHPIVGTGPNTYNDVSEFPLRRYYDRGARNYTVRSDIGIGVHNLFFEKLSDTGLLGFISFVALLLYFVKTDFLRLIGIKQAERKRQYLLFALSSWAWILYGITDNGYGAQGMVTFFFLRGILNHL